MCDVDRLFLWSQVLFKAGEEKFGTDEQTFVTILGNRSAEHLRKGLSESRSERQEKSPDVVLQFNSFFNLCASVFDAYMKLSGYEMEETIKRETSGSLRDLLLAVGTNPHDWFRFCH